jgi:hypothetical protein
LYFNAKALENSLSGAVIASEGEINFKVLGDVLVGLTGQIKSDQAIKFDLQGNFVNLGLISSNNATTINAKNIGNAGKFNIGQGNLTLNAVYDIVNIGTSLVNKGNVHLKAGHDIKELILINSANPVPNLSKRAIYAIGGSLYYEADHDIIKRASVIFASGNVTMIAGNDIYIETIHQSRKIKEEYSRKHYLIQTTIDQYDAIVMVEGSINTNAGNNFIGSGIRLSSDSSDVNITAGNRAILEDKTGYAWNYQSATKTKFLGQSSVSVSWTTSQTANLEITAPGGRIYVSSKECTLEGGVFDGQKPIFKCDKLLIKPHVVVNKVITTTTQSGMFTPNVPIIDLVQSSQPEKHLRDHTIAGPINSLINMQGPLDLLPAVNLISSIPSLKADYKLLEGAGLPSTAALVGALLSKYISASISFGTKKTTTSVTQTISTLTQISGSECEFKGIDGEIAANVDCQNSVSIEFDNLKLAGAKNTLHVISETESSSFDVGVSLSGVSFGVSFGKGNFEQDQVVHNSGTIHSKNVSIKINNKLEIENAQINGKNVTVEALSIEIKQVIDSSHSTSESYGGSLGVTVGWTETVMPTISAEYANAVQQSQVVHLLSGITGESVEVTAQKLTYNIETISAEKDLSIKAESLEYISLPQIENIDTEFRVAGSISPRSDGKTNYAASIYSRDGDEVMSIGYNSAFMEGINDIKEFLASKNEGIASKPQNNQAANNGNKPNEETNGKAQTQNKNEANVKPSLAANPESNDAYKQSYRSDQEYAALQRKGIIVNDKMSYNDDAIDGEFLSKLDSHEFGINIEQNKLLVFLNMDVEGNIHFKEYDLDRATKLRDSYRNKYGSSKNDATWNIKYTEASDKLSKKNDHAQNYKNMEEAWSRTIKKEYPAEFVRKIDQYYVVIKGMVGASFVEGKYYLKEEYPGIYNAAAKTISSIGNGIKSTDEYLESSIVSRGWKTFKSGVGEIATDIHENQAEFVGDMLLAIYGDGIGGAAISGAKNVIKTTVMAGSKVIGKGTASKLDDIAKAATHTEKSHSTNKVVQPRVENHAAAPVKENIPTTNNLANTHHDNLWSQHQQPTTSAVHSHHPSTLTKSKDAIDHHHIQEAFIKPETRASTSDNTLNKGTTKIDEIANPVAHNVDNDFLSKYSFTDDLSKIDFETTPKFELGKISSASKHQVLNKLPEYIPDDRVNYNYNLANDLGNFIPGTEKLFHGKLSEDLYLINYHDKNLNLGINKGERTMKWATHLEVGNKLPSKEEILQHLALVEPDWGVRNSYSIIKIPAGEQVTFISGKTVDQISRETKEVFLGGGYQIRFRDFDEKWIIDTKDLNK